MRNFIEYIDSYSAFPFILNISITGTVVIAAVLLARLFLRRSPKIISYALWAVVLFRLLCPFSLSSDFSLFSLFDSPIFRTDDTVTYMEYVPVNIVHIEYPEVYLPVPGVSEMINRRLPSGDYQLGADPMEGDSVIAMFIWMFGCAVMFLYAIVSYAVLRIRLVGSAKLQGNIRLCDHIPTPFVLGLVSPMICLPASIRDDEKEYIILHERHHIRRGDHIWRMLAYIALSLHWFNPFVWAAFVISGRDMEMSCDEAVIRKLGDGVKADYSQSLLNLSSGKKRLLMAPPAFGENDTAGRIRNIAGMKKPAVWVTAVTVFFSLLLVFILAANPHSYDEIIRVDGQNYIRFEPGIVQLNSEESIPETWEYIGDLRSVIHRSASVPDEDMQGVNLDPRYAGCPIYRDSMDPGMIYLHDYSGIFISFAFTGDIFIREAGGNVYDPTKITYTEPVVGGIYETGHCLYMTLFSSYLAIDGDSGYRYILGEDELTKIYKADGSEYPVSALSGWKKFPWTDEEWNEMFDFGGIRFPSKRFDDMRVMEFGGGQWLMDMDGELWLVDINSHPNGESYIWSIYTLVSVDE